MQLANITNDLVSLFTAYEPESDEAILLNLRINALQSLDKALDLQLRRVDTQREAVQTEIDSVQKIIAKNIATTFKTFA
jgi:hypothetical protein